MTRMPPKSLFFSGGVRSVSKTELLAVRIGFRKGFCLNITSLLVEGDSMCHLVGLGFM